MLKFITTQSPFNIYVLQKEDAFLQTTLTSQQFVFTSQQFVFISHQFVFTSHQFVFTSQQFVSNIRTGGNLSSGQHNI